MLANFLNTPPAAVNQKIFAAAFEEHPILALVWRQRQPALCVCNKRRLMTSNLPFRWVEFLHTRSSDSTTVCLQTDTTTTHRAELSLFRVSVGDAFESLIVRFAWLAVVCVCFPADESTPMILKFFFSRKIFCIFKQTYQFQDGQDQHRGES